jgi:hypothetical protein
MQLLWWPPVAKWSLTIGTWLVFGNGFHWFSTVFKQRKVLQVFAAGESDRMGLQYSEISELCRLYLAVFGCLAYFIVFL